MTTQQNKMQFIKQTAEVYTFAFPDDDLRMAITLSGSRVNINSDHGDWSHTWPAYANADETKKFLCRINMQYVAGKMGADRVFDHDATVMTIRAHVKNEHGEQYDFGIIDDQYIDAANAEIETLSRIDNQDEFCRVFFNDDCDHLRRMLDSPPICQKIDPHFAHVWRVGWTAFIDQLKKELA